MGKTNISKTNALRVLDMAGVSYEVKEYECKDTKERDLGLKIATLLNEDPDSVFKTLVLHDVSEYVVCCIPVAAELDLKAAAQASGHKHLELLPLSELQRVTGYIRGGCTPIGMKRDYPVFIDETAELFDTIVLSAGRPGLQLIAAPEDIVQVTGAQLVALTR